jgi:aminoglycoside/choline kinase family phosphotransferase
MLNDVVVGAVAYVVASVVADVVVGAVVWKSALRQDLCFQRYAEAATQPQHR